MPEYRLSDDCKLALVQARFEAIHLGTRALDAGHLLLGVTKSLTPVTFARLFPRTERFESLCRAFDAGIESAPLSAEDIEYALAAREAIAGGMSLAIASDPTAELTPLYLLLGILRPLDPECQTPVAPSSAAALLLASGVTAEVLLALATETAHPA